MAFYAPLQNFLPLLPTLVLTFFALQKTKMGKEKTHVNVVGSYRSLDASDKPDHSPSFACMQLSDTSIPASPPPLAT